MGIDLPLCIQDANDILEVIIRNEKLVNPKVTFHAGSNIGEVYFGINGAVDVSDGNKILHLFIKAAPKHDTLRENCHVKEIYGNEFRFYTVIFPKIDEFFKTKTGKSFELISKFYAGSIEEMKEIFVFENLTFKGFALNNEKYVFGKERAVLVMKEYGRFHGVSFALKDQDTKTFNNITNNYPDILHSLFDKLKWESAIVLSCRVVEKYLQSAKDSVLLDKLTYISKNVKKLFFKLSETTVEPRIIVHGDSNFNNMMFRSQENGLEMRLLDFQGNNLSSPALDLCNFFYCSASSEENLAELDVFLETYYSSLSSTIKELGSDPEKLYPFSMIKEHWKEFCVFSLIMAILILPASVNDGDPYDIVEMVDQSDSYQTRTSMNNEEEYAKRIKCILQHFIDNNFI